MDLVPERKSLLSATTTMLRDAILAGEWSDLLPGERKLCERMGVGRDTLRLALKQLEREEIIGKGDPGKRRPILITGRKGSRRAARRRTGTINYLSPHRLERMTETSLAEIDVLRGLLAESGVRLEIVSCTAFAMVRPATSLGKLLTEHKADAWILHHSTEPMQRWFQENGIPCLLHGMPHEKIDLPFVDIDFLAIGHHAGGFLSGRGHERVAFLDTGASLRGIELAKKGLQDTLSRPLMIFTEQGDAANLARQIDLMLGIENRPTAVVATRSRQILTLLTFLGQKGVRVPQDLSIVVLDYNPYLNYLVPAIACYRIDIIHAAKTLAKKALELAGTGSITRIIPALMPDFHAGGSVAKL